MMLWRHPAIAWALGLLLSVVLVLCFIATWGHLAFGSIYAVPALARGEVVVIRPKLVSVGEVQVDQRSNVVFTVINLHSQSIVITGLYCGCTCVSGEDELPLEIPAHGRRSLRFLISPTDSQAGTQLSQTIQIYLSVLGPPISVTVSGTVAKLATEVLVP